jgi:quinol monooxygenase YgiN
MRRNEHPSMNVRTAATFAYLWEYVVRDDRVDEFRLIYGSRGKWAELFSQSYGYVRTELHRDINNPSRFLTIDYWASKEARDRFQEQFASEFTALDETCEALTVEERFVGDFELDAGSSDDP